MKTYRSLVSHGFFHSIGHVAPQTVFMVATVGKVAVYELVRQ